MDRNQQLIFASLALLIVNVGVAVLVASAFSAFLFRQDAILAAVLAIFALPAILLQPWFLLFAMLPWGTLFAPLLTTLTTVFLYTHLDRRNRVHPIKRLYARLKNRTTAVSGAICVMLGLGTGIARYIDFPALSQGLPVTLARTMHDQELSLRNPRYYCLSSFIDSEWLWQTGITETELSRLVHILNMYPIQAKSITTDFYDMPPYWWNPAVSEQAKIFSTPDFPMQGRGPDGWHALVSWNPEDELLHMWIKDNF